MIYKKLLILVEGPDDENIFNEIVKPKLKKKYHVVEVRRHSELSKTERRNLFKWIRKECFNYFYIVDMNDEECIPAKKQKILARFNYINEEKIIVIRKEIEGWYRAGYDEERARKWKIKPIIDTNSLTKEQFNRLIPPHFTYRLPFMWEILKHFQIETAKKKNISFNYFFEKHDC